MSKNKFQIFLITFFLFTPSLLFFNFSELGGLKNNKYKWMSSDIYFIVLQNSKKYNLDSDFIFAIIHSESRGKSYATSYAGARGLMQIMPFHHNSTRELYSPNINICLGCKILVNYKSKAKGDRIQTLKNYNSGPASNYYNIKYIREVMHNYMIAKGI